MKRFGLKNILLITFCMFLMALAMIVPASAADNDNIDGCQSENLDNVADYYANRDENGERINPIQDKNKNTISAPVSSNTSYESVFVDGNEFTCSKSKKDALGYKTVYLQFKDENGNLKQMLVVTDKKFDTGDITIDLDNAQLKIGGIMSDDEDSWNAIYSSMQKIIVGATGVGILICLLAFVLQFIRLGASAGNPMEREKVLKGIIWTGIGTAGCGAATLIFGLAFGMI